MLLRRCLASSRRGVLSSSPLLRSGVRSSWRSLSEGAKQYSSPWNDEPVEVDIGIVHFGVGRFHRAHQAVYVDEILQRGDYRWGMCGVCLLPQDEEIYTALKKQKGEFHVIEMDSTTTVVKKIGSIVDVLWGHKQPEDVLHTLGKKSVKIVSFTVTEAGYFYHPSTKSLDFSNEALSHDLELYRANLIHYCSPTTESATPSALQPNPRTLFGYLSIGMLHRYLNKVKPFTIMSCDNIQGNGDMIKKLLLEFCGKVDPSELQKSGKYTRFLTWMNKTVAYPNSMVDRITPAASQEEIDYIRYPIKDYEDFVPVSCEHYRQWVIEDNFCNVKPKFETLENVSVVSEIKPYEKIKIRCLNGGHSTLGYAGYLAGFTTIDDTATDDTFQAYLRLYFEEVSVTLDKVEGIELLTYQDKLIERFSNDKIKDDVLRICKDGSSKLPGFIFPTIVEVLERGNQSKCLSFVVASWIYFVQKHKEDSLFLDDGERNALFKLVDKMTYMNSVRGFLSEKRLFGDVASNDLFINQVQESYDQISDKGAMEAVKGLVADSQK